MLKELLKKLEAPIRLVLWSLIVYHLNILFILVPYRNKELNEVFQQSHQIVKQHCDKSQYNEPNFFTSIAFANLKEEIAYCQRKFNGFVIVFDKAYWNFVLSPSDKKQVMMHEAVHCFFNQEHVDDPRHFMAPYFEPMTDAVFDKQVEDYLKTKCGK